MIPSELRKSSGFTLIEVLMVVMILGITSAIIIPQISQRDDLQASAAARVVMADLIYAQNRAITTQEMTYVKFTPAAGTSAGSYSLISPISPTPVVLVHPTNPGAYTVAFGSGGGSGLNRCAVTSAAFNGQTTLAFDELGTPYAYTASTDTVSPLTSGSIVVTSGAVSLNIHIQPYTGEITVQ